MIKKNAQYFIKNMIVRILFINYVLADNMKFITDSYSP